MIKAKLESEHIPNVSGGENWTTTSIRSILTNEKYCGDVLRQKTYISDCISKKVIRNTGQLPMYLIRDHHEGIIERKVFDAVQAEMSRRKAAKSPTKSAATGLSSYASKYALSERLVCGECGTLYRRCTWVKNGRKRIVWRCVSRLDYGTKYCHNSPTLDEEPLQRAILAALNKAMGEKEDMVLQITGAMERELASVPGEGMSLAGIERRIEEINQETRGIIAKAAREGSSAKYTGQLKMLMNEVAVLKEKQASMIENTQKNTVSIQRVRAAADLMEQLSEKLTQWDEGVIRQLVDTVKVVSAEEIVVYLRGGVDVRQELP